MWSLLTDGGVRPAIPADPFDVPIDGVHDLGFDGDADAARCPATREF
jgi:hypothetical protein